MSELGISGIQEAQQAVAKMIKAIQPTSAKGRAIQYGTVDFHRHTVAITHVVTGALKGSHRIQYDLQDETTGFIFIDPNATNPVTGERTAIYGVTEHDRGGGHAFYARTLQTRSDAVAERMVRMIIEAGEA